jgi:hypothetical protein
VKPTQDVNTDAVALLAQQWARQAAELIEAGVSTATVVSGMTTSLLHVCTSLLLYGEPEVFTHNRNATLVGLAEISQSLAALTPPTGAATETVN